MPTMQEGDPYEEKRERQDVELPTGYKVPKFDMFDGKAYDHGLRCFVPWNYSTGVRDRWNGKSVVKSAAAGMTRSSYYYILEGVMSALVKVLNEAYVLTEITSENFLALVGQVLKANTTSCYEYELPPEDRKVKTATVIYDGSLRILKSGFVHGRGLGVKLDGILDPVQLSWQKSTFGLRYEPTLEELSSANIKRKYDILLTKPVLLLN
ncbi:hypothetical protein FXO38_26543 [Capsicum annuum]|nr:hypothetical protein FXO38_26543 [Capsicum annuum]KAF3645598.1 hypothetical protein FXO37_20877 [Capsicum annuum]